jgi:hypothetical protein
MLEPHTPRNYPPARLHPLGPAARAPPELEAEGADTPAFAFNQSRSWDPTVQPPDPGFSFNQTLN